ncbi:MAG: prefoldin subunit alpha [Candidatus Micrarchaeota archaeon]
MGNDEEIQKLAYEAQYLQQQLSEMQRQLQQAIIVMNNIDATTKTIDGLKGLRQETYFQIGSDAFVKAKPQEGDKILIDAGANVLIEKEPHEAKEILRKRKEQVEKATEVMKRNIDKLNARLMDIEKKAEEFQ